MDLSKMTLDQIKVDRPDLVTAIQKEAADAARAEGRASRAALLKAWRFYRRRRAWIVRSLRLSVYESWLTEAFLLGRLAAPGLLDDPLALRAWAGVSWVGPAPGYIQPKQEAEAASIRVEMGLTTLAKETAAYDGSDWEANHRQSIKERGARDRDGLAAAKPGPAPPPPEPNPDEEDIGT